MPTRTAPCPSCDKPRPANKKCDFVVGSACPHRGHVEVDAEGSERPPRRQHPSAKDYLGDGVYVDLDAGRMVLTVEDGRAVRDRIVIEPETWEAMRRWVKRCWEEVS